MPKACAQNLIISIQAFGVISLSLTCSDKIVFVIPKYEVIARSSNNRATVQLVEQRKKIFCFSAINKQNLTQNRSKADFEGSSFYFQKVCNSSW